MYTCIYSTLITASHEIMNRTWRTRPIRNCLCPGQGDRTKLSVQGLGLVHAVQGRAGLGIGVL